MECQVTEITREILEREIITLLSNYCKWVNFDCQWSADGLTITKHVRLVETYYVPSKEMMAFLDYLNKIYKIHVIMGADMWHIEDVEWYFQSRSTSIDFFKLASALTIALLNYQVIP